MTSTDTTPPLEQPDGAEATAAPAGRVRLVALQVQPMTVVDDGDTLTPAQMPTMTIPAAQLADVPRLVDEAITDATQSLTDSPSPDSAQAGDSSG